LVNVLSLAHECRVPPADLKKKKPQTTSDRPEVNLRIVARPSDALIMPLWAESKGFQYIP
jgi:hypothetical protein